MESRISMLQVQSAWDIRILQKLPFELRTCELAVRHPCQKFRPKLGRNPSRGEAPAPTKKLQERSRLDLAPLPSSEFRSRGEGSRALSRLPEVLRHPPAGAPGGDGLHHRREGRPRGFLSDPRPPPEGPLGAASLSRLGSCLTALAPGISASKTPPKQDPMLRSRRSC